MPCLRLIWWSWGLFCGIYLLHHIPPNRLLSMVSWFHSRHTSRSFHSKTPVHLHLSLTENPSQVLVQFTTFDEGIPVAAYGWKGEDEKVTGTSTTFSSSDLCYTTDVSQPTRYFHTVVLSNLVPDTHYHYQVAIAMGQGTIWSETVNYFVTPPIDEKTPYSFVVLSNQGVLEGRDSINAISKEITVDTIRAIHYLGGLSLARGNATIWDDWFQLIQAYSSRVPLLIAVGNTEYDYLNGTGDPSGVNTSYSPTWGNYGNDSGGECGVVVAKRFQMPHGGNGVFWYRHETPLVTTIVLSSEHDFSSSSPQFQWLQQQLQELQTNKWIILEIHRPLYMNQAQWSDNNVGLGIRRFLEPLLQHKVDLVLSGHYKAYFRSCPGLFQSRCRNGGPTHITVGSAGIPPDGIESYPTLWTAKSIRGQRGYGRVTAHNRSALEFQWIGLDYDSDDGNILDQNWMFK